MGVPVVARARYEGVVRAALLAHKDDGRLGLVRPLGDALASAFADLPTAPSSSGPLVAGSGGPLLLVPVPSTRAAVRTRGHDHALRLARRAARRLRSNGVDTRAVSLLTARRFVVDQVGLDVRQRHANRSGAFAPRRSADRWRGVEAVVVDDIVTTGASLRAAAQQLRTAGIVVRGAVVVAAVPLRPVA